MTTRVLILGSTGSVGRQTIDAIAHVRSLGRDIRVVGLCAGENTDLLEAQARALDVRALATTSLSATLPGRVYRGERASEELVREVDCDLVVSAIVGVAGLGATLAAAQLGRTIALANKESLVAGGLTVTTAARRSGAKLLPVDSEHGAAWQCLASVLGPMTAPPLDTPPMVRRLVLTASGGALRDWPIERLARATPQDAQQHPTWAMGRKVTIDTASLMNKTLELVEAHWLFGLSSDRLSAIVHPQSLVHALIELEDGSMIAQLAPTDMGVPIHRALCWPQVLPRTQRLNLAACGGLEFKEPDRTRFPAIDLGLRAIDMGGCAGAVLNGANEAAVQAFCESSIGFLDIARIVDRALDSAPEFDASSLEGVFEADGWARRFVQSASRQTSVRAAP